MKKIIIGIVLFLLSFSIETKAQEKPTNKFADIPTVDYCQIVSNPKIYNGNLVKITAEYYVGFEHSILGSQNCMEAYGKIWIEFEKYESCGDAKTARLLVNRYKGNENNLLEGVFVGKFFVKEEGKSGFGHMNAKPFQITVSCVESARLLPKENSGCQRVDETSPFHYLEYVKTEVGETPRYQGNSNKKERLVWFRLVNNSSCSIIVPTADIKSKELQNEENELVIYNLDNRIITRNSSLTPFKPKSRLITDKSSVLSTLTAGKSIYFAVPLRYFEKGFKVGRSQTNYWNISVPFKYADRETVKNYDQYYDPFYFARTDLPKEIFKK